MADAFLIIVVLILMIVMFFINLYIIAYFSHPLESKFGGSIFAKIIIAFSMLIIECEILAMPLDVSSSRNNGGLDMKGFWFTMTMTSWWFIFLVLPIAYFYSDAEGGELSLKLLRITIINKI